MKYYQIRRKGKHMIAMVSKPSKMVLRTDLLAALRTCLTCYSEVVASLVAQGVKGGLVMPMM